MVDPVRQQPAEPAPVPTVSPQSRADIERVAASRDPGEAMALLRSNPELAPQIADAALRHGNFSLAHAAMNAPAAANDPALPLSPSLVGTGIGLNAAGQVAPVAPVTLATTPPAALQTIPMLGKYGGEHLPGNAVWDPATWGTNGVVNYLTPEQSAARRLTIGADGKFYNAAGQLFDTTRISSHGGMPGRAIFVMDQHGNLYTSLGSEARPSQFHHSSLLAGRDVAMAGEIEIRNGQLKYISNQSGHYQPPDAMLRQAETFLRTRGVDFSQARVDPTGFPPSTQPRLSPTVAPMTPEGLPATTPAAALPDANAQRSTAIDPNAPRAATVDPAVPRVGVDPSVARATRIAEVAGKVGRPLIVVGAAVDAYTLATADNKVETGSRIAGGWGGAWAGGTLGAKGGAVVGTFIGGPVGTVVGGIVGGVVGGVAGYIAGSELGQAAYDALKEPAGALVDGVKDAWKSVFG